jgi:carbon storage regulator
VAGVAAVQGREERVSRRPTRSWQKDCVTGVVCVWDQPESIAREMPFFIRRNIMLVLSRKKNESIVINDDITLVVIEIRGDKVRLGIEAPKSVEVHRREVYEAIQRHNLQVNSSRPTEPNARPEGEQDRNNPPMQRGSAA